MCTLKKEPLRWVLQVLGGTLLGAALLTAPGARAQSEASAAVSMLPLASVGAATAVGGSVTAAASVGASAVAVLPAALSVAGSVLVVKAVEVTAQGVVLLLERAHDGARASVRLAGDASRASALTVGTAVTVGVLASGVLLSTAGQVLAFVPNELGRALLHHEQVTP